MPTPMPELPIQLAAQDDPLDGNLASVTPSDLSGYLAASLPKNQPSFQGREPQRERKHFLVINPVELIDRSSRLGEAAWMAMVDHHLFPRHSSCNMIFEDYYHTYRLNLPEMINIAQEEPGEPLSPFTMIVLAWLNQNGYFYVDGGKLHSADGEVFDGVLLDICW